MLSLGLTSRGTGDPLASRASGSVAVSVVSAIRVAKRRPRWLDEALGAEAMCWVGGSHHLHQESRFQALPGIEARDPFDAS
jgi:hypothetical protein